MTCEPAPARRASKDASARTRCSGSARPPSPPGPRSAAISSSAPGGCRWTATVAGSVLGSTGNYTSDGSVGGSEQVNIQQPEQAREPTLADRAVDALRRYVSLLVIGVLLLWLLPRVFRGAAEAARGRTLVSLGVGLLGFLAVIVALVLVVLVTVLVAVVLGLLGLGSLAGVTVFGGLLVAAIIVFLFVLAVGRTRCGKDRNQQRLPRHMDCWFRQRAHRRRLGGQFRWTTNARHVCRAGGLTALGSHYAGIAPTRSSARSSDGKR